MWYLPPFEATSQADVHEKEHFNMFNKDKKNFPLGSRQNPIVKSGSNSQAGLQAIKNRKVGPVETKKK